MVKKNTDIWSLHVNVSHIDFFLEQDNDVLILKMKATSRDC